MSIYVVWVGEYRCGEGSCYEPASIDSLWADRALAERRAKMVGGKIDEQPAVRTAEDTDARFWLGDKYLAGLVARDPSAGEARS